MKRNNNFFKTILTICYPVLLFFVMLNTSFFSMFITRKNLIDKMKLEITGSIFEDAVCTCDTILNKLNFIIKHGVGSGGNSWSTVTLSIKNYETYAFFPQAGNNQNDIAIVSELEVPNYFIMDTEPNNPSEGSVWIYYKQTSSNLIVTDTFQIPIAYVKQYQSGKWVLVDAAIYDNSGWQKLDDTSEETATKSNIQKGYTAIVNGKKITGTLDKPTSYFQIDKDTGWGDGDVRTIKLKERKISVSLKKESSTATENSLMVEWNNDTGLTKQINLCTDKSTSSAIVGSIYCTILNVHQISPYVAAIVWKKETITKITNSGVVDRFKSYTIEHGRTSEERHYLTTVVTDGTSLTTKTLQLNSDYYVLNQYTKNICGPNYSEIDLNGEKVWAEISNENCPGDAGYSTRTLFQVDVNYNLFADSYNESMVYFKINSTRNIETIYANQHSEYKTGKGNKTETCKRVESFAINKYTGVIEMYEDTSSVTRTIGHCVTKYENEKYGYSANTSSVFTNRGLAIMTYNNTMHDLQTKIDLYDINIAARRTQTTLTTPSLIEETNAGQIRLNFTDEFEGKIRYLMEPKITFDKSSLSFKLSFVELDNVANIPGGVTPTIKESSIKIYTSSVKPTDDTINEYNIHYSKKQKKYYIQAKTNQGIIYIVCDITEDIEQQHIGDKPVEVEDCRCVYWGPCQGQNNSSQCCLASACGTFTDYIPQYAYENILKLNVESISFVENGSKGIKVGDLYLQDNFNWITHIEFYR